MTLTLALVPLDERPVNTRYPQMLGAIGGPDVLLPPEEIRGRQRVPADLPAVADWLREAARRSAAALVSTDYLGYGNLISARISDDSAADALARLRLLADINADCPVHAFSLITRVSNADDNVEEPLYWARWGATFYRYSQMTSRAASVEATNEELSALRALEQSLPADLKADWLARRLRNHTVNLGLLDMAARDHLSTLLLTSDDTAPYGFPSAERRDLGRWPHLIGPALADRVMMHPGADEVGSALVARLINQHSGAAPRVWIEYAIPDDEELVAPYEDRPIRETVQGQIGACGCVLADAPESSDFLLGVVTPSPRRTDYRPQYQDEDRATRTSDYAQFLTRLAGWQAQGRPVALADVAYPNGSDPLLMEMLLSDKCPLRPAALCAYGAWNTAGNTLGVVVAQAACALHMGDDPQRAAAQRLFLAHRFLEDWGYQAMVRREARADAESHWGRRDPDPEDSDEQAHVRGFIERRLAEVLTVLQRHDIGAGLSLAPGSVRLPWRRTFEADFDLRT
ncbi:MAG: DUF4127 family protein [Armatimonadetes bacterium]|nr:DUF4127 family protein [Armatimonadota bacterium]